MATLRLNSEKLRHNYEILRELFAKNGLEWGIVTKLLSSNEVFLKEVLKLKPQQVCDSRISNLRVIKNLDPTIETVYIKPVPIRSIQSLLDVADISFNSELSTLQAISRAALQRGIRHRVIISVELGDRREGIMESELLDFFEDVFQLQGIDVIGLAANLNCLNGVMPNEEKLLDLSGYRDVIQNRFHRSLPIVSGGSSVTIPLVLDGQVPHKINHFRVGESLFFGADLFAEDTLEGFHNDVFEIEAEIIELSHKPVLPEGELSKNVHGEVFVGQDSDVGRIRCQGIIDIGSLDIGAKYLQPLDENLKVIGSSSDMTVLEFPSENTYSVGSFVKFRATYMVVLRLMNSRYVEKVLSPSKSAERKEIEDIMNAALPRLDKQA